MKKLKLLKKGLTLFLVLFLCINNFAAIVSDNDGSAFITKAEFDSLKNDFQSQIDKYNTSIDAKIDGAIAAYLAGIKMETRTTINSMINKKYSKLEMISDGAAIGWRRVDGDVEFNFLSITSMFRAAWHGRAKTGTVLSTWTRKGTPIFSDIYTADHSMGSYLLNPTHDERYMTGKASLVDTLVDASGARYMTTNWGNVTGAYGTNKYGARKSDDPGAWAAAQQVAWQQGVLWGQEVWNAAEWNYDEFISNTSRHRFSLAGSDNTDPTYIVMTNDGDYRLDNFTTATNYNSNYFKGGSMWQRSDELEWIKKDEQKLLGAVGTFNNQTLQFFNDDASKLKISHARTNIAAINKSDMKYDVTGTMLLLNPQESGWSAERSSNNTYKEDAVNWYKNQDIVPDQITTWQGDEDNWPNMLPFDIIIPSLWFTKAMNKSRICFYDENVISGVVSDKLEDYLKNYSWNRGFPMWEVDGEGKLSFKPTFENTSNTYLLWCLNGPSDSDNPYSSAPSNYYLKNDKCSVEQIKTGNGKGAFRVRSGDSIIIDGLKKNDIVYLYFTTEAGKGGVSLINGIDATFEKE